MPRSQARIQGPALLAAALVLAGAALLPSPFLAAPPVPAMVYSTRFGTFDPGQVWHEQEGSFKGTWTRRGDSNVFDAHWTDGAGHEVRSEVTLESIIGRTVVLSRKDIGGVYTGTVSDDGRQVLDGTVSWANGPESHWTATLILSTSGAGIRVDLSDGSWICGDPTTDGLDVRTAYGSTRLKWPDLSSIRWKPGGAGAQFDMSNGDRVTGWVTQEHLGLKTSVGPLTVPIEHMKDLTVVQVTEAMVSAPPAAPAPTAPAHPEKSATKTPAAGRAGKDLAKAPGIRLALNLADGGCLIGESAVDRLDVKTEHGVLKLEWPLIRSVEWKAGEKTGEFALANDDRVSGQAGIETLDVATLIGPVTVPLSQVRRLEVLGPAQQELELDLGGGVTMKLVLIPAGHFSMGSPEDETGREPGESPVHEVTLSSSFYMGVTEVTQAQCEAIMGANTSNHKGPDNPVDNLTWPDAVALVRKLAEKTSRPFRLPTEAEWEYACRAGSTTRFHFGDDASRLGDCAWYQATSGGGTHAVALMRPNAWGLYDMHGNVWEYCSDWFGDYPKGAVTDPTGPAAGEHHVIRGGSWDGTPDQSRSAYRGHISPELKYINLGVRVVLPPTAETPKK